MFTYSWFFGPTELEGGAIQQTNLPNAENTNATQPYTDTTNSNINSNHKNNAQKFIESVPGVTLPKEKPILIETPLMSISLLNGGTSIGNITLKEHKGSWFFECDNTDFETEKDCIHNNRKWIGEWLENESVEILNSHCNPCLYIQDDFISFHQDEIDSTTINNQIIIKSSNPDKNINKETIIYKDSYIIDHIFNDLPDEPISLNWTGGIAPTQEKIADELNSSLAIYVQNDDGYSNLVTLNNVNDLPENKSTNIGWAALWSKYFQKAITNIDYKNNKANEVIFTHSAKKINDLESEFIYTDMKFKYNQPPRTLGVESYIGPIDTKYLTEDRTSHLNHLFYGKWYSMGPLKKVIIWLLTSLYAFIPNYGIICILFAFIIRLFTGPLTKKSFLANQKMQALQPKIKNIQTKHKDDKQKASQETMALYKKEGVNPLGGCLPILIQMPLLIALFQAFQNTIEFRGASFIPYWIPDLSQPDVFIQTQFLADIPLIGWFFAKGIALLPIIMGVVMFLNMKMTTATTTDNAQKFPMYLMNGFFILLFNTFPSGLNLYYTVYNILNFIQQKQLKKLK